MKVRHIRWASLDRTIAEWGGTSMQHYTRNTVSVAAWCPKCKKETQHRVDDRRRGPCLECLERPVPVAAPKPKPERGLFDVVSE